MQRRQRSTKAKTTATKQVSSRVTSSRVSNMSTLSVNSIPTQSASISNISSTKRIRAAGSTTRSIKVSSNTSVHTTSRRSYHPNVIDHYENPRNVGSFNAKDADVGTGLVGAPACGDVMKLQVKVNNGVVEDVKFRTFGCGSAIASSSYATEWLKGKTVEEALTIKNTDIASHLSLPPVKMHCSMLAEDAVKAALQDYKNKQSKITSTDATQPHNVAAGGVGGANTSAASAASIQQQMQSSGSPHTASADV